MNPPVPARRRRRWWVPAVLMVLWVIGVALLWGLEVTFREQASVAVTLLTLLALAVWFVFLTGFPFRIRLALVFAGATLLAGVVFGIRNFTRIEGSINGSGIPRLVWKWSPRRDAGLQELSVAPPTPNALEAFVRGTTNDFPQFLGPNRSGVITGLSLARDWSSNPPRQVWRQPIGVGWSAFAVSGPRAVTQEQRGEKELIVCYELSTGRVLWSRTNRVRFSEVLGGDGPRATPTLEKGRVYAIGATGILDCLDETTGKLTWSRDVLRENGLQNITWGKSSSPLLLDESVIVTGGAEQTKSLLAYHKDTGQPLWQSGRDEAGYCSPSIATIAGRRQILILNAQSVSGHDPRDGKVLWDYSWRGHWPKVAQPLALEKDRVFIGAGYGLGCVMLQLKLSDAGQWSITELWKNRNLKPKFTNVVRREDCVYGLDDGTLVCLDLGTGERKWKDGRYGHGQVMLVDDVLLIQAESGDVVLVEANPSEHRELGRFSAIEGKTWNNPALAGNYLLVRNDQEAACYELPLRNGPVPGVGR
ncbi:MAG TPA: PQQ-binding-like beta-propeller repeat protein [Verrucomicrobiae bacterium]|nr:PQQ-binding-like beta-propeller repeat protein [Verrucomicrobiae bacterium]